MDAKKMIEELKKHLDTVSDEDLKKELSEAGFRKTNDPDKIIFEEELEDVNNKGTKLIKSN